MERQRVLSARAMMKPNKSFNSFFQFSLCSLMGSVVVCSVLIGANYVERPFLVWDRYRTPQVRVANQTVVRGWPLDAAMHFWTKWDPESEVEQKQWYSLIINYPKMFINIGVGLLIIPTTGLAIHLCASAGTMFRACSFKKKLFLLASCIFGFILISIPRPLSDVPGAICLGFPQPFIQTSPEHELLLFSTFSLLANFVFLVSILSIAIRVFVRLKG